MSGRSRVDDEVITLSDNQPAQLQPVEAVKPFKLRISFCYQTKQITISARRFQRAFIKIIKSNGHFIESRAINPLRQWLVDAWPLINEAAQLRTSHFLHRHIFIDVSERAPLDCRRRFLISNRSRGQIALLVADNEFSQKASSFFPIPKSYNSSARDSRFGSSSCSTFHAFQNGCDVGDALFKKKNREKCRQQSKKKNSFSLGEKKTSQNRSQCSGQFRCVILLLFTLRTVKK